MGMKEYTIENKKVEVKSSNSFFYVAIDAKKYDVYFETLFDREKPKGKKHGLDISLNYLQEKDPTISNEMLNIIKKSIRMYVDDTSSKDEKVFIEIR